MNISAVTRLSCLVLATFLPASSARAKPQQAPITGDVLVRQEWNDGFFAKPDPVPSSRTRFQIRPRFEVENQTLLLGVGADINYSKDDNLEPKDVPLPLALIRDNYDSRSIRLDLAYLGLNLSPALQVRAGRMVQPLHLTEMLWDKDLRIQGGSAALTLHRGITGEPTVRLAGIYSRGSHVFVDSKDTEGSSLGDGVTLKGGSLDIGFGSSKRFDVSGSYLVYDKLDFLERKIRRQNTRVSGALAREYQIMDVVVRLRADSPFPIQVVFDGARNRKAPDQRDGVWGALVLGSLEETRFKGEYTFARVDRDVTVASYATDDFFWGTGWLGHRAELAFAQSAKSSLHVVGQMQRFKDSANPAERTNWFKRLRLEVRRTF